MEKENKQLKISDKLRTIINKLKNNEIINNDYLIEIVDNAVDIIGGFNPELNLILRSFFIPIKLGYIKKNDDLLKQKFFIIIENINSILKKLDDQKINIKAHIFAPELYRKVLIVDDLETAKLHLKLITLLYTSEDFNFNDIYECLRILGNLNNNELKILKLLPLKNGNQSINMGEVYNRIIGTLENEGIELEQHRFEAIIFSLINSNLVEYSVIGGGILGGGGGTTLGKLNYGAYINVSKLGELFLETINNIINEDE